MKMANRRCIQTLTTRLCTTSLCSNSSLHSIQTLNPNLHSLIPQSQSLTPSFLPISTVSRHFSSNQLGGSDDSEDNDDEEEDWEDDDDGDEENVGSVEREYTTEEKESEAAAIGYKVIGRLEPSDRVFKQYEPVFAVIQLILNKVLILGSKTQTMIGRPVLPDAAVHAVVEEHALDAKVIKFKKKRRKNYRRKNGHRQVSVINMSSLLGTMELA